MIEVVGQAENLIRRRLGIDSAAAYSLLVRLPWQQQRPIESIARGLIANTTSTHPHRRLA